MNKPYINRKGQWEYGDDDDDVEQEEVMNRVGLGMYLAEGVLLQSSYVHPGSPEIKIVL